MKKSLAFLTGICLALSSGLASAAIVGGWNVGNPTPVGAAGLVYAAKNVGGVAKTSNASITPNASQVSKILRGGVAGIALTVAVNELLDGIDWVMDPANNQIKYYIYTGVGATSGWREANKRDDPYHPTSTAACLYYAGIKGYTFGRVNQFSERNAFCYNTSNYLYVQLDRTIAEYNGGKEQKNLPLDTVSQTVIDKAEAGNKDAQVATVAAAQEILNEAQNDAEKAKPIVQQLEANAIVAGIAPHPNNISHDREDEIRNMKPNDPCDEISQAIKDLEETVTWRKSDLNPNEKGTKKYVGHQKRIKILNDKKDDLKRAYTVWCEGN